VRRFFDWCFTNGSKLAEELEYIPLPESVHNAVRGAWRQSFGA
jgi:phosphate transport system substrate-binding protein